MRLKIILWLLFIVLVFADVASAQCAGGGRARGRFFSRGIIGSHRGSAQMVARAPARQSQGYMYYQYQAGSCANGACAIPPAMVAPMNPAVPQRINPRW